MAQATAGVSPAWLATLPLPSPPPLTFTRSEGVVEPLNTARTLRFALRVTVQVGALPVQAPRHSLRVLPGAGVAVRVTTVCRG
jgi:hypothetical protein